MTRKLSKAIRSIRCETFNRFAKEIHLFHAIRIAEQISLQRLKAVSFEQTCDGFASTEQS
jgi:hypothetical protein